MSISVDLYTKIKSACLSNANVKAVGLWNNQALNDKDGKINPVRFPFIGIQFENTYDQLSNCLQQIDGVFVLYICLQSLQHKDEDVLAFKDSIYQTLMINLPKSGFGDLYRSFEVQDTDHEKSLIIWQQEYEYSYIDNNACDFNQALTGWTFTENVLYDR
jgi:hypothetical protein